MTNTELGNLLKILIPNIEERISEKIKNSKLGERETEILILRIFDEKTLEQVANRYGVTRERIRQVEARAYRKLRHPQTRFYEILDTKDFDYYCKVITEMLNLIQHKISKEEIEKSDEEYLEDFTLEDLNLSIRPYNVLKRNGISNMKELQDYSKEEIAQLKNLGRRSFEEVVEKAENIPFFSFKEVE